MVICFRIVRAGRRRLLKRFPPRDPPRSSGRKSSGHELNSSSPALIKKQINTNRKTKSPRARCAWRKNTTTTKKKKKIQITINIIIA